MRFVLGRMGFPYIRVVSDQVFFWYSRDMQGRQGKRETYHNPYQYPCKPPTKSVSLFAGELDDPVANTSFSVEAVVDHTVQGLQNGGYIHHPSKDGCGWLRHVTGPLNQSHHPHERYSDCSQEHPAAARATRQSSSST